MTDFDTPPSPLGGWSQHVETLDDALVMPPAESDFVQTAGVLRADGTYCATGAFWRNHRPLTVAPPAGDPVDRLPGNWLYAGVLWVHFGHFLVESTGRLWGLDASETPLDGLVYIPKRPARGDQIASFQQAFWALCGCDLPVRVLTEPTQIERLTVPGQGFGLGQIVRGTKPFRKFILDRFGQEIAADGPERLYISRSKLGLNKGGLIGEAQMEAHLADQGYDIFHPQEHDLPTQIARYKAARQIVAAEGSALHLFGFVGRPEQQVAIIVRRRSGATDMIADHLRSFCGIDPVLVETLQNIWKLKGGHKKRHDLGVLHMTDLQSALANRGFVDAGEDWPLVRWPDVRRVVKDRYEKRAEA